MADAETVRIERIVEYQFLVEPGKHTDAHLVTVVEQIEQNIGTHGDVSEIQEKYGLMGIKTEHTSIDHEEF